MKDSIQSGLMAVVDGWMAALPCAVPERSALARCRLVSHRGEYDGDLIRENTLRAFASARAAGVWGIECDVRWSADLSPVICHDPSATRVFRRDLLIGRLTRREITGLLPELPHLEDVLQEFGGNTHLMLELKPDNLGGAARKRGALRRLLTGLTPVEDFHVLSLQPALFELVDFLPPGACLPVATTNVAQVSRLALERRYGGVAGHYLLLGRRLQLRHAAAGQSIGTGFPASRNCLFRELSRGVDWIFSNRAARLQRMVERELQRVS